MIALLQRVSQASVSVSGRPLAAIDAGLLALIGVEKGDTTSEVGRLAERLLAWRMFPDAAGRMNLSVMDSGGSVLLVPQFTLAADTSRGNRPGFDPAAPPEVGRALFEQLVAAVRQRWESVAVGEFGADMDVSLVNRGPATFWLRVAPGGAGTSG
jgi:D-tyrosyl-tRNA(Tyr) deacylase